MKSITVPIGFAAILAALAGCSADIREGDGSPNNDGVSGATGAVDPGDTGSVELPQHAPPPDWSIVGVKGAGTGCPPGSTATEITPDRTTFTIYFSKMVLQARPERSFQRLNCTVGVTLHVPNGFSMAAGTINTRGYAHLEKGASANQNSLYSFAGRPLTRTGRTALGGPLDGPYTFTDDLGLVALIWSPCGTNAILNIDAGINLDTSKSTPAPDISSYFDTELIDGMFRKEVHLQFRKCPI